MEKGTSNSNGAPELPPHRLGRSEFSLDGAKKIRKMAEQRSARHHAGRSAGWNLTANMFSGIFCRSAASRTCNTVRQCQRRPPSFLPFLMRSISLRAKFFRNSPILQFLLGSDPAELCPTEKCLVQMRGAFNFGPKRLPQSVPRSHSIGGHFRSHHGHRPHFSQQVSLLWIGRDYLFGQCSGGCGCGKYCR